MFDIFSLKVFSFPQDYYVDVSIQVSKKFFVWVLGSEGKIRIQSPQKVEQEFYEFFEKIKSEY